MISSDWMDSWRPDEFLTVPRQLGFSWISAKMKEFEEKAGSPKWSFWKIEFPYGRGDFWVPGFQFLGVYHLISDDWMGWTESNFFYPDHIRLVVVQPMINRLDTVPPPKWLVCKLYIFFFWTGRLHPSNGHLGYLGSSFWTTFKVIQIPPPPSRRQGLWRWQGDSGSFFLFFWVVFSAAFPVWKLPSRIVIESSLCFFVVIFESRWTEQDTLFVDFWV